MKKKGYKSIIYGLIILFIITIGIVLYSSNRSSNEAPKRAKLVENTKNYLNGVIGL